MCATPTASTSRAAFQPVQLLVAVLLLSLLVMANSVAVVALSRRVRALGTPDTGQTPAPYGPPPGTRLDLGAPVADLAEGAELILFADISPVCGACRVMLPEFVATAARVRVVLVSAVPGPVVRQYLADQGIDLPLVTGEDVFDANDVPGPPYAVVTDGRGVVLAQGGANRPEQLTTLLDRARALRPTGTGG